MTLSEFITCAVDVYGDWSDLERFRARSLRIDQSPEDWLESFNRWRDTPKNALLAAAEQHAFEELKAMPYAQRMAFYQRIYRAIWKDKAA